MKWTDERCDQLDLLKELLYEVSSLNSGNKIIEKLQKVIELANNLKNTNYRTKPKPFKKSFFSFLLDSVIESRTNENKRKNSLKEEL